MPIESLDDHLEFFVAHNMFKDETAATSLFSGLNLDDETKLKCEKGACDEVMIELGDLNDSLLDTSLDGGQNSAENDLGFFYFEDKAKLMNDKAHIELNVRRRFYGIKQNREFNLIFCLFLQVPQANQFNGSYAMGFR